MANSVPETGEEEGKLLIFRSYKAEVRRVWIGNHWQWWRTESSSKWRVERPQRQRLLCSPLLMSRPSFPLTTWHALSILLSLNRTMIQVQDLHNRWTQTIRPNPRAHSVCLCLTFLIRQYILRNSILFRPRPLRHVDLTTVYEDTVPIQRSLPRCLAPKKSESPVWHAIWPWSQSLQICHLISPQGSLMRGRWFPVQPMRKTWRLRSCSQVRSILLLRNIFNDMKRGEKCKGPILFVLPLTLFVLDPKKQRRSLWTRFWEISQSKYQLWIFSSSPSYVSNIH